MINLNGTENLYFTMCNSLPVGIFLIDLEGCIVFSNKKATEIFGYEGDKLVGKQINSLVPMDIQGKHEAHMLNFNKNPSQRAMSSDRVLRALNKKGKEIKLEIGLSPIMYDDHSYIVASIIEYSNKIFKMGSFNDPLTGLPNRRLFLELSNNLLDLAIRTKTPLTIIYLDLDNFKAVNDRNSHDVGDKILCKVADIIHSCIRKNDIAARIGGDEYLICLYDVKNNNAVKNITGNILSSIALLNKNKDFILNLGASIGTVTVTVNRPNSMGLNEIIKIADKLMYEAKHSGKNKICSKEL